MRSVIIMSGCSGSGKSFYANRLLDEFNGEGTILSADNFFMSDEGYKFDASKLSKAHSTCFLDFIGELMSGIELVIVDNTSCTHGEISPYWLASEAFVYEPEIITMGTCDQFRDDYGILETFSKRNSHNVPLSSIRMQANKILDRNLPPWYKCSFVPVTF